MPGTRLVHAPGVSCNASGPGLCKERCHIDIAARGIRQRRAAAAVRLMEQTQRVRTPDGDSEAVHVTLNRASNGLSFARPHGRRGLIEVGQRSWKKWMRAPSDKRTWSVKVGADLVPQSDLLGLRRGGARRFSSCAVVGGSGSLLAHACGAAIDAHEAVIRLNDAPVKGYERWVGSRETFRVLNSPSALPDDPRKLPRPSWGTPPHGEGVTVLADATSEAQARIYFRQKRLEVPGKYKLRLIDHSLLRYIHALRGQPRLRVDYPSTGLQAVVIAASLCRKVVLYGFSLHRGRRKGLHRGACANVYHYYDRIGWKNLLAAHNLTAELSVVRVLPRVCRSG